MMETTLKTQRRLGIDISMIGAREEILWEGQEVKQKNYHLQQMNPWKSRFNLRGLDPRNLLDFFSYIRTN